MARANITQTRPPNKISEKIPLQKLMPIFCADLEVWFNGVGGGWLDVFYQSEDLPKQIVPTSTLKQGQNDFSTLQGNYSWLSVGAGPMVSLEIKEQFPPLEEGIVVIQHINTGRGDGAFFIFSEDTILLMNAVEMSEMHTRTLSARNTVQKPNNTKSTPAWIVD